MECLQFLLRVTEHLRTGLIAQQDVAIGVLNEDALGGKLHDADDRLVKILLQMFQIRVLLTPLSGDDVWDTPAMGRENYLYTLSV